MYYVDLFCAEQHLEFAHHPLIHHLNKAVSVYTILPSFPVTEKTGICQSSAFTVTKLDIHSWEPENGVAKPI